MYALEASFSFFSLIFLFFIVSPFCFNLRFFKVLYIRAGQR